MSKVRVYELAKRYGMKGPELAEVLRGLGFDQVKSHMAVLDEADQMMMSARLEAQGLQASGDDGGGAAAGLKAPPKKKLPKKKLPTQAVPRDLPKKKLPPSAGAKTPSGATVEAEPEPGVMEPVSTPEPVVETPEVTPPVADTPAASATNTPDAPTAPTESPAASQPRVAEPGPAPSSTAQPAAASDTTAQPTAKPSATPELSPDSRTPESKPPQTATPSTAAQSTGTTPADPKPAPTAPAEPTTTPPAPVTEQTASAPAAKPATPPAPPSQPQPQKAPAAPAKAAPAPQRPAATSPAPQPGTEIPGAAKPAAAPRPAAPRPAARQGQPSQGQPAPGKPAAGKPAAGRPAAGRPAAGKPAAGRPAAGQPTAGQPTAGKPAQPGAPAAGQPGKPGEKPAEEKKIKRLIEPKAKAKVIRRIELPEATIRDATRRSAPGGVDKDLRKAAAQRIQSRSATRGGPGQRRPHTGTRGGPQRGRGRGDGRPKRQKTSLGAIQPTVDPNKVVEIEAPISVKALSEALGVKVAQLLAVMMFKLDMKGKNPNSFLTEDDVELIALELGRNVKMIENKEAEEQLGEYLAEQIAEMESAQRAPIVTFMGHVDHGKTTLLDTLRKVDTKITTGEAGGITQHIGAFRVDEDDDRAFVVLDTPGHAAFTAMRARGANITDVVVLVVAADDGVMPQTEEALSHAKAAEVPIVVAVNKCDLPGANPDMVRQQMSVKGLQPEEWGGTVAFIDVSALTGQGLSDLVDRILLEAEVAELSAQLEAPGSGVVVESRQSAEQGIVVNGLVMNGTLKVRDQVICGESYARVRGLTDDLGRNVPAAGPATPVSITGMTKLPQPGDKFFVVADAKKAKEVIEERSRRSRDLSLAERSAVTMENLGAQLAAREIEEIKLIVRADVMGSLEPIKNSLAELATDEVRVNIIHAGLGNITETDVTLGSASEAMIIGFNTVADGPARSEADRAGVEIRYYDVIYKLIDEMKLALEGLLKPEELEKVQGHAEVRAVFKSSKFGNIAGCYINDGFCNRNSRVRLSRDGKVVYKGTLNSLRRIDDDVREVKSGFECGMTLTNFNDIKEGDSLEFYDVELVKRTLS